MMLSIEEVAKRYDVATSTVWRWRKAEKFPAPTDASHGLRWDSDFLDFWDQCNKGKSEPVMIEYSDWKIQSEDGDADWTTPSDVMRETICECLDLPENVSEEELYGRIIKELEVLAGIRRLIAQS